MTLEEFYQWIAFYSLESKRMKKWKEYQYRFQLPVKLKLKDEEQYTISSIWGRSPTDLWVDLSADRTPLTFVSSVWTPLLFTVTVVFDSVVEPTSSHSSVGLELVKTVEAYP